MCLNDRDKGVRDAAPIGAVTPQGGFLMVRNNERTRALYDWWVRLEQFTQQKEQPSLIAALGMLETDYYFSDYDKRKLFEIVSLQTKCTRIFFKNVAFGDII